jgi:magnesium transporter
MERLPPHLAVEILASLSADSRRDIVTTMDPVRAVAMLGWMDEAARAALLDLLAPSLARELRRMAEYPPETAGRLMDPRATGFAPGTTVQQALERLRAVRNGASPTSSSPIRSGT